MQASRKKYFDITKKTGSKFNATPYRKEFSQSTDSGELSRIAPRAPFTCKNINL